MIVSLPRAGAAILGVLLGIALGLPVASGWLIAPIMPAMGGALLYGLYRRFGPHDDGGFWWIVALGVTIRLALASVFYYGSLWVGRGGYIVGDDANYAALAAGVVGWYTGNPQPPYVPPTYHGSDYLLGTFVYLEVALFALFGPHPLSMTFLHASLMGVVLLLLRAIGTRVFETGPTRLACALVAAWPSLIVWSALNLKEVLALLIITAVFFLMQIMQTRPDLRLLLAHYLVTASMETIRRYVYVGLALLFAIGVLLRLPPPGRRRWAIVLGTLVVTGILLSMTSRLGPGVPVGGLFGFEATRRNMAAGARTAFVDPAVVPVREGMSFLIQDLEATPTPNSPTPAPVTPGQPPPPPTTPPPPTPPAHECRSLKVAPNARLVLGTPPPNAAPDPLVVYVLPCDVVTIGTADTTPRPEQEALGLRRARIADTAQFVPSDGPPEALVLTRTLAYIPKGIVFALFAPFPWALERPQDYGTVPEMLLWYVVLAALPVSLWRCRRQWRDILPLALYVVGILFIFVLTEGNFGTLFRHRAMIIPYATLLASPVLYALWRRLRRSRSA